MSVQLLFFLAWSKFKIAVLILHVQYVVGTDSLAAKQFFFHHFLECRKVLHFVRGNSPTGAKLAAREHCVMQGTFYLLFD